MQWNSCHLQAWINCILSSKLNIVGEWGGRETELTKILQAWWCFCWLKSVTCDETNQNVEADWNSFLCSKSGEWRFIGSPDRNAKIVWSLFSGGGPHPRYITSSTWCFFPLVPFIHTSPFCYQQQPHHSRQIGAFVLEPLICAFSDWHAMSVPCQRGFPGVFIFFRLLLRKEAQGLVFGLFGLHWRILKDQKFTRNTFFQYTNSTERDADQEKLKAGRMIIAAPKFNMEIENDGFHQRNLLLRLGWFSSEPAVKLPGGVMRMPIVFVCFCLRWCGMKESCSVLAVKRGIWEWNKRQIYGRKNWESKGPP